MSMFRRILMLAGAAAGTFVLACGESPTGPPPSGSQPGVVIDSTKVTLLVDSAAQAAGKYTFSVTGPAPTITPGQVIVGTQNGGFLRKVTIVDSSAGQLTLTTTQAALTDVIEEGSFDITIPSTGASQRTKVVPLVADIRSVGNGEVDFTDLTFGALAIKSGRVRFQPVTKFSFAISGFTIQSLDASTGGTLAFDADMALTATSPITGGDLPDLPLFKTETSWTGYIPTPLGPWPVTGVVEVTFSLTGKIGTEGAVTIGSGFRSTGTATVGATYRASQGWSFIPSGSGSFTAQPLRAAVIGPPCCS